MAITPTTLMSALQPLNDEEIKQGPYDIRSWDRASETREQRITALNELIQKGSVSMVVSAITEPPGKWVVYMLNEYATAVNDAVRKGLFDWAKVQEGENIQERCAAALQITLGDPDAQKSSQTKEQRSRRRTGKGRRGAFRGR